jgi:hypothetical protein
VAIEFHETDVPKVSNVSSHDLKKRWYVTVSVVLVSGVLVPGSRMAPAKAQTAEAFVVSVKLPSEVAGGSWSLTVPTESGADVGLRMLGTGRVPKDGALRIPVEIIRAAQTADDTVFLHVSASRVIDKATAWATSASVGLPQSSLAPGTTEELTAVAAHRVPIHWDKPDTTPVRLDRQRRVEPSAPPKRATKPAAPATAPTRGAGRTRPSGTRARADGDTAATPVVTGDTSGQGMVPQGVVAPTGCRWYGACEFVKASKLIPGVRAFRWFSSQGLATTATFVVESGFEQQWQNGVRAGGQAGPFKAEGFSTRTKTSKSGIVDEWPTRADCWAPPQPGDDPGCGTNTETGRGFVPTSGRDTWQWQKVVVSMPSCYEPGCRSYDYTEERLRNYGYDGGDEIDAAQRPDFDHRPSEVFRNRWGRWAIERPGGAVKVSTETQVTVEGGATIGLEFSPEEGAANGSFTSTSTQKKVQKVTDAIVVRKQEQLPFLERVIRYDGSHEKWKYIYWTCEKVEGWSGGDCWDHGS